MRDGGEGLLTGWSFQVVGPEYPTGITATDGGAYDEDGLNGCVLLNDIAVGLYTVTEVLKTDWKCTDPGGTAPYQKMDTVVIGDTWHMIYVGTSQKGRKNTIMAAVGHFNQSAPKAPRLPAEQLGRDHHTP